MHATSSRLHRAGPRARCHRAPPRRSVHYAARGRQAAAIVWQVARAVSAASASRSACRSQGTVQAAHVPIVWSHRRYTEREPNNRSLRATDEEGERIKEFHIEDYVTYFYSSRSTIQRRPSVLCPCRDVGFRSRTTMVMTSRVVCCISCAFRTSVRTRVSASYVQLPRTAPRMFHKLLPPANSTPRRPST